MIPALVLAAGASRRMGRNKLMIEVGGKSILHRVLDSLLQAGLKKIIVVTGFEDQLIQNHCEPYAPQVEFVLNAHWARGRTSSVQRGLEILPKSCPGVLITPGDLPFLEPRLIKKLVERFRQNSAITFPLVGVRKGHPVIFPKHSFQNLKNLRGEQTLNEQILAGGKGIQSLKWPDGRCLMDADTAGDLALIRQLLVAPQGGDPVANL